MQTFKQYLNEEQSDHDSDFNKMREHLDAAGIDHHIYHNPKTNTIHVSKIIVKKNDRGTGKGHIAMKHITDHADKYGKRVTLTPSTHFGASSVSRLKTFYKSHGFVENKGKHKDYSTSESMYREPK